MTKKTKKIKSDISDVVTFDAPEYIQINGYTYERQGKIDDGSKIISLDLDDKSDKYIEDYIEKNPGYSNKQEFIREILRNMVKENATK